jgi:hypothetical protein
LYGRENWSLSIREELRLWVFEIRVLRRIFGPKREELTKEQERLHNGKFYNFYSSPKIFGQSNQEE